MKIPASWYRPLWKGGPSVSPVGFGCYRVDDRDPAAREALRAALAAGVNLVDTSTNYADGHSEILVGQEAASPAAASGPAAGTAVTVVTKAGYVQGTNQAEAVRRIREGRPWEEMVEYARDCWHCISPGFLADQLTASLERLRRPRVDVLLLHNPEYFLLDARQRRTDAGAAREAFYERVGRAFRHLDEEVARGRIGAYGVSSNTLVVPRESPEAVDLARLLSLAGPAFRVVQLPLNPLELGARQPIHSTSGASALDVARDAGLGVLVNRPLNAFAGGGLVRFAPVDWRAPAYRGAPAEEIERMEAMEGTRQEQLGFQLDEAFGPDSVQGSTISRRTVRSLLSLPGVTSVLVGMRRLPYVEDVVGAFAQAPGRSAEP